MFLSGFKAIYNYVEEQHEVSNRSVNEILLPQKAFIQQTDGSIRRFRDEENESLDTYFESLRF